MRILSKRKNHLLQFLNLTRKLNTDLAVAKSGQLKILMKARNSEQKYSFSILSDEGSSWYGCLPKLPFPEEDLKVAPSCNGLVHLYRRSEPDGAVWNPWTSEMKFLPPSDVERPADTDDTMTVFSAIGFDWKSQDYKILRYVDNYVDYEDPDGRCRDEHGVFYHIEMYSFKTDSWKKVKYQRSLGYGFRHFSPSVHINGCYYWDAARHIMAFDFAEERFFDIKFPHFGMGLRGLYEMELVEIDGCLGCVLFPVAGSRMTFDYWVLKEEGGLWKKEATVRVGGGMRLLGFMGNGQVLFLQNGDVKMYDCSSKRLEKLYHMHAQSESQVNKKTEFIPYVESKLPLAQQLATSNTP